MVLTQEVPAEDTSAAAAAAASLGNERSLGESSMVLKRQRWNLGLLFLLAVVVLWVSSSFMVNVRHFKFCLFL